MIDLSGIFTGKSELFADHVHTTKIGSQLIAKKTADLLSEILLENQKMLKK